MATADLCRQELWPPDQHQLGQHNSEIFGRLDISERSLRYTIDEAKGVNMPRDTIQNAIKKGTGELGAENYEPVQYEGYGPSGVAIMPSGVNIRAWPQRQM